jgi:transposase-like protein
MKCKFCGSDNLKKDGTSLKAGPDKKATKVQKYQCKDCGKRFQGEVME